MLLVPKGTGPFPAALMLHDHGARFDIGKENRMAPVWAAWKAADRFEARMLPGGHEFTEPAQDAAFDWLDVQINGGR